MYILGLTVNEVESKTECLPIFKNNNENSLTISVPCFRKKFQFEAKNKQEKISWIEAFKKISNIIT